ncbi:MAG: Sec-independent protein translocase protein TatB, partial [Proteobacteria bacterium]|nr:Sec-independent protein translocase protein TatB [Pseudomonadota bacterium]
MFDICFSELLIVFVVMLLVVGPDRLPGMARKIGLYIRKTKNAFNNIKRDVERELEMEALKEQLKENNIMEDVKNLNDDFQELTEQVNQTVSTEKIIPNIHSEKSKTPQAGKP